jgi:cobalt-zinc-cadmium efflux system outer membrane protein
LSRRLKSIHAFLPALVSLALLGCQAPMPPVDTAAGISRTTMIDSAIEWHTDPQPIDAPANADHDSALSLPQATQLAIRNSPGLQSALWKVRIAEADARQERLLPNPVLAFTVRFVEGGGKPALEASIAQDLLSLLRRNQKITAADHRLRAASADALKEAADLIAEAQQSYIAAAIVDEEIEILAARRQLLDRLLQTARTRLAAGEGTRLDVTTLEAQRIELDADAADKAAERTDQRITLARIIGRPAARIDWTLDRAPLPAAVAGDEKDWITTALSHRPELESRRWELAALATEAELARWSLFDPAEIGLMSQRDPDWQLGPTISAPLPIFDNGSAKRDKAQAARIDAAHQLLATQRQVIEDVRKAYAALTSARAAVARTTDELLPLLEQRRDQAEAAYKAGESDLATLLLAQDSLQSSRFKLIELKEKSLVARIKLERAAGGRAAAATSRPPPKQVTTDN